MPDLQHEELIFPAKRFWLTMLVCAILYLPSLFWGLGLDQNIFAEIGSLLLSGHKLYVDAWDVKPPNVFYTYALFERIFGQNEFAVRISDYCCTLFACAAMFMAVRDRVQCRSSSDLLQRWAPVVASVLLSLTLLSLGLSDTAQTESYSLGFILLAPYLAFRTSNWKKVVCGICIAIAAFYKTTNGIFLLPIILDVLLSRKYKARRFKTLGLIIGGFVGWSMLQLGVLALEGSLSDYHRIAIDVLHSHPNEVSSLRFLDLLRALWVTADAWTIVLISAIVCALLRGDRQILKILRLPLFYLVAGLIAVYVQNKGWGYHYVITHAGLISACAISAVYLYDKVRVGYRKVAIAGAVALILLTVGLTPSARRRLHYASDAFSSVRNQPAYVASLGRQQSLYHPASTDSLATYIKSHSSSSDTIFILGEEPGAYWRSHREPATKFVYSLLFTSGVIPAPELQAMSAQINAVRPTLIVIERFDTTSFRNRPETSESLVASESSLSELKNALSTYRLIDTVSKKFLVYRRP